MVCCLLFDGDPLPGDQRALYGNQWRVSLLDSCGERPLCCFLSCACLPCSQVMLRQEALNNEMQFYKCCQGYYDNSCCQAGSCCDKGNVCCLVLEAWCCTSCAISASRQLVMDTRDIRPDPMDNQIIRFSNAMQWLACICDIVGAFYRPARHLAHTIEYISNLVYLMTASCMTVQTYHEIQEARKEVPTGIVLNWDAVQQQHVTRQQMKRGQRQQGGQQQQQQYGQAHANVPVANPVSQTPYQAMGDQSTYPQQQQQQQQPYQQQSYQQQQQQYQQQSYQQQQQQQQQQYQQPPAQAGYPGAPQQQPLPYVMPPAQAGYPGGGGTTPQFDPVTGAPLNDAAIKMRGGQ